MICVIQIFPLFYLCFIVGLSSNSGKTDFLCLKLAYIAIIFLIIAHIIIIPIIIYHEF